MKLIKTNNFLLCGDPTWPQCCVRITEREIMAIVDDYHKTIAEYPCYAEAIDLPKRISAAVIEDVAEQFGTSAENYRLPILVGGYVDNISDKDCIEYSLETLVPLSDPAHVCALAQILAHGSYSGFDTILVIDSKHWRFTTETRILDRVLQIINSVTGATVWQVYRSDLYQQNLTTKDIDTICSRISAEFEISFTAEDFMMGSVHFISNLIIFRKMNLS